MLPTQTEYPDFVPDQLLTSEDLNSLFHYLDEQGRMTRTNLVGVGIVCGLELRTKPGGDAIVLTKGTGVTTEGYLVSFDETEFSRVRAYDPKQERVYDKFVDADKNPKLELWEIERAAAAEGSEPLSLTFLNGNGDEDEQKVALAFVELREEQDKNCNPESCDDKGRTIFVNLRVLLARKADVESLGLDAGLGTSYFHDGFANLPVLPLPRFDVPASQLSTAADIFLAYKKLLPPSRVAAFRNALTQLWTLSKSSIAYDYGETNPFQGMDNAFAIVSSSSLTPDALVTWQYLHDHFGDMLAAYEELRQVAMQVTGLCCPDASLFPRHLLLGQVIQQPHVVPLPLRHGFQAAPVQPRSRELERLESLFRRLVLMTQSFDVPSVKQLDDTSLRITPSKLGQASLSQKAIPWYYPADVPASGPLFTWWSYDKTRAGRADTNLGYHATSYSSRDEIRRPLAYDLEPYDFLRVEGHVGQHFTDVLENLQEQIQKQRLPIDVVALALGNDASGTHITDATTLIALKAQFEALKAEVLCCLREQAKYWASLDTGNAFKKPGKWLDYGVFDWFKGIASFKNVMAEPARAFEVLRAMNEATVTVKSFIAEPAAAGTPMLSKKGQDLLHNAAAEPFGNVAQKWLDHVSKGDVDLSFIPPPAGVRLDAPLLEHWALIILDQIEELIVALDAEELLSLNVDAVETHRDDLVTALETLTKLVEQHLAAQIPVAILKTYLSDSYDDEAELIGLLMVGMTETDAHQLVRVFLNSTKQEIDKLIQALGQRQGDLAAQREAVTAAYGRLDIDGMMIPAVKVVVAENDPFFERMRAMLQRFGCLCAIESFRHLRELLAEWLEGLRRLNLFEEFVKKHSGIQHKAGVPLGGTLVLAYQHASKVEPKKGPQQAPNPAEAAIRSAAAKIPEGTVVADFYLPYICCSDQPPIQFQVLPAALPPESATLSLDPNKETGTLHYSVGDEGPYEFAAAPPGGALQNALTDLGVDSPSAGRWRFHPSWTKTRLGTSELLELGFTYVHTGVPSPELKVTVHNLPDVTIDIAPRDGYHVGGTVDLTSTITRASALRWTINTPSETSEVADAASLEKFPLKEAGVYSFQLTVKQVQTGRLAISPELRIVVEGETAKPTLKLEENRKTRSHDYSVSDQTEYPFTLSPAGGNLIGASPEVGVEKRGDHYVFIPAAAKKLGRDAMLVVDFSNSIQGTRSDPVQVRIFAPPSLAIFGPDKDTVSAGTPVEWTAQSPNAETFEWTLRSPSGNTTRGSESVLKQTLTEAGEWTISVEAKQTTTGETTSRSATIKVAEARGNQVARSCGDLQALVTRYEDLAKLEGYRAFKANVLDKGVDELFAQLRSMANDSVESQLKTFRIGASGSWVPRITEMTEKVAESTRTVTGKGMRTLLVQLYRLLGNVLFYINCISDSDLTREQVTAMTALTRQMKGTAEAPGLEGTKLDVSEMEILVAWRRDVERALENEKARTGGVKKTDYERLLTTLRKAF
jgi:hypothetical protein